MVVLLTILYKVHRPKTMPFVSQEIKLGSGWSCLSEMAHFPGSSGSWYFIHVWHEVRSTCRFYTSSTPLCDSLRPHSMRKVHGLRARVIRMLFHVYAPFQTRMQTTDPFKRSPETLEGARCLIMWHRREKDSWLFYFKFRTNCQCKANHSCFHRHGNKDGSDWDIVTHPADVHYNMEEHCCVLCVVTQDYMCVTPSIMGQVLQSASVSVSQAMRYHKLKLLFTSEFMRSTKDAAVAGCTVVMDPVLNVHLLHWWHPRYPCALSWWMAGGNIPVIFLWLQWSLSSCFLDAEVSCDISLATVVSVFTEYLCIQETVSLHERFLLCSSLEAFL